MRLRPQKHPLPTSETLHAYSSQTDADASEKSRFALKAGDHGTVLTSKLYNAKGSAQRTASNRRSAFGERRERRDLSSGESMSDLRASNGQAIDANETLFERIGLGLRHRFSEGEWTDCNGGRSNAIRVLASRSRSSTCARRTEDCRYESATRDRRTTKSLWRYRCRRSLKSNTTLASDKKHKKRIARSPGSMLSTIRAAAEFRLRHTQHYYRYARNHRQATVRAITTTSGIRE